MLAAIFMVEVGFLGLGWYHCLKPENVCGDLGDRSEKIFNVAIATTLSLMVGSKIGNK